MEENINQKLFVGNVPWGTTEDDLRSHFAGAGTPTDVFIKKNKMTGRSEGFGFITMSTPEEAQKAIELFGGKDFQGRELTINIARPRVERPAA